MVKRRKPVTILIADDDPDDQRLTSEALAGFEPPKDIRFVGDGEELIDYLRHRGKHADADSAPRPGVILLDLNLPRKDGREALREIKQDPELRLIPVTVLTVSNAETDIHGVYDLGANSYLCKPRSYTELMEAMRSWSSFWLDTVELPINNR
jgi:CheY-like chemotaxis protein